MRPVLDQFLELYSDVNLWVVSNQGYQSLFNYNDRIKFIGVDLKKSVFKIYQQVKNETKFINFEGIYDFHDVIRSKSLCFLLKNKTHNNRVFIKDRATKQKIITHKIDLRKLKHTSERYLDCLKQDFPKLDFKKIQSITNKQFVSTYKRYKALIDSIRDYSQEQLLYISNETYQLGGGQTLFGCIVYHCKNAKLYCYQYCPERGVLMLCNLIQTELVELHKHIKFVL